MRLLMFQTFIVLPDSESTDIYLIKDKDGAEIPLGNLTRIISQYSGCACFIIYVQLFDVKDNAQELKTECVKKQNAVVGLELLLNKEVSAI